MALHLNKEHIFYVDTLGNERQRAFRSSSIAHGEDMRVSFLPLRNLVDNFKQISMSAYIHAQHTCTYMYNLNHYITLVIFFFFNALVMPSLNKRCELSEHNLISFNSMSQRNILCDVKFPYRNKIPFQLRLSKLL